MNIYKIVLTGGPCAGKTKVLNHLKPYLEEKGYYVITIPETATYLIKSGTPPLDNPKHAIYFQDIVLKAQLTKEEIVKEYCKNTLTTNKEFFENNKGIIILCDRGIMDNRAYISQQEYDELLKRHNLNELELLYSYDLAINLISLATTNPELYELDEVRYETKEKAAERDRITSAAWLLHPNLKSIKPTKTIEEKLTIVEKTVDAFLNNPEPQKRPYIDYEDYHVNIPMLESQYTKACKKTFYEIIHPNNSKSILIKINSDNSSLYILDNTIIKEEEYLNLLKLNLLKEIDREVHFNFILNGTHYKLINDSNNHTKLYAMNDNINKSTHTKLLKKTSKN